MVTANFTVTPSSGFVFATDFIFSDTSYTDNKIIKKTWDLGDGTFLYDKDLITKSYNYPGVYTISLTATDLNGGITTKTAQISADYYVRDLIVFDKLPSNYANPGDFTPDPFRVKVFSTQIDQPLVLKLFAANSPSTPYEFVPEHWRFLTPTWRFTDNNFNTVTNLSVATNPIFYSNENGDVRTVGTSGIAEFYYVDDLSTGDPITKCPVVITATLETSGFSYPKDSNIYSYSGYSNNKFCVAATVWRVNNLLPNVLKVTENYLTDIFPYKWEGIKIPFVITCHNQKNNYISNILFSYPDTNYYGGLNSVVVTLSNTNGFVVDEAPLYFQSVDNNGSPKGGFIFTTITPTVTAETTVIQVSTVANFPPELVPDENEFAFPASEGANTNIWISNPTQNTLNRVFIDTYPINCDIVNYYKNNNILFDGAIATTSVPYIESTNTYNYSMSGFSGIYGICVDPADHTVIAADAELDRLYRISTTGAILSTYALSSLGDYIPNKKLFHTWTWTTPSETLSATYFTFYSPALISSNPNNYILLVGGVHQPNGIIFVDPIKNALQLKIVPPYAPGNVKIDLIEIFDPQLPSLYSSSLVSWTTASPFATTIFPLTGTIPLSADPNYYIVSVDGALQMSDTYTVDNTTKTLTLCSAAPPNTTISVLYIPTIYPPANWIYTSPVTTSIFNYGISAHPNFRADSTSQFLVNVGGVLQSPNSYNINFSNNTIVFDTPILANIPVSVTQVSVSGDISLTPAYTPSYVSLDQDRNIWVSLFNDVKLLKFDSNFNLIGTAVPDNINWPSREFTVFPQSINYEASLFGNTGTSLTTADYYVNEFFLKPPIVETDKDNSIWATYAHPLCSMIVKYNNIGSSLYEIPLPKYSVPVGLAINKQNNVWVSNSFNTSLSDGSLQLYSTTGTLMSTITGFTRPGYIAVDKFNNLWFTHGLREIGYVSTTGQVSSWLLSANNVFVPIALSAYPLYEDEEFGGIAVDVYNRVWVIDSLNNTTFVFPASTVISNVRGARILPDSIIGYYNNIDNTTTYTLTAQGYKSAQATGDWTGNKWYQKYYTGNNLSAIPLQGTSAPFSIRDFTNPAQIYRKNENFNAANYLNSLALPENLHSNTNFFDSFLGAVVGNNVLSAHEDMGQKLYERVANFTLNFADIDTCEINQLISFAEQTNTSYNSYNLNLPADIQKYLNIASISKQKLWGMQSPIPLSSESIGKELNITTAYVTAGTKIFTRNKFNNTYSFYNVPLLSALSTLPISAQSVYPLSSMDGIGLIPPFLQNYLFYDYTPVYSDTFIENIIDWSNPNTTLSPYLSSTENWIGESGTIEKTFNYLLTKNLIVK